jgi:hypothetical protein
MERPRIRSWLIKTQRAAYVGRSRGTPHVSGATMIS